MCAESKLATTRRTAERAPHEACARHGKRKALRAANDNQRLRLVGTTGAVARNFTYASNAYQITGITDTPAATHPWLGQSWSFSYDGSDRLLTGNGTIAGNSSFSYDKLDNATSFAGATASYNNLNQITAWNAATHTYDNNGNLTGDGTRTYTYDAADRLKTVTQGGTTTTFAYDGLGRRLKQTVGTTETRYLWCGAAICQQRSNTDTIQKRFFAEGEYVLTGTKKYLTLTDHLGSVRDLVDITGTPTLVGSFDYTPYGAVARTWGTVTPGYTYAGLFAHPQTGLLLSATRTFDPSKGRWITKDPIRERGGLNLYGYVGASPMMGIDPLGLLTFTGGITIRLPTRLIQIFWPDYVGSGGSAGVAIQLTKDGHFRPDFGFFWGGQAGGQDIGTGKGSLDLGFQEGGICDLAGKGIGYSAHWGFIGGTVNGDENNRPVGSEINFGPGYNVGAAGKLGWSFSIRDGLFTPDGPYTPIPRPYIPSPRPQYTPVPK